MLHIILYVAGGVFVVALIILVLMVLALCRATARDPLSPELKQRLDAQVARDVAHSLQSRVTKARTR